MSTSIKTLKNKAGFSLVEVLVVVSILAIVASVAAPNITKSLARQKMKSEATTIASLLQQAKIESTVMRKTTTVSLIPAASGNPARIDITFKKNGVPTVIGSHELSDNNITLATLPASMTSIDFKAGGGTDVSVSGTPSGSQDVSLTLCYNSVTGETPRIVNVSQNMRVSYSQTGSCT